MGKHLDFYTLTFGFFHWWYTDKVPSHLYQYAQNILQLNDDTRFEIMLHNFFVPLYQDRSFAGHIISMCIRALWIITSGTIILTYIAMVSIYLLIWILLPFVTLFLLFFYIVHLT